jgi:hypothetical protein
MKYNTKILTLLLTTTGVISSPEIEKYDLAALHACHSDDLPEGFGICDPLGESSMVWCGVVWCFVVGANILISLRTSVRPLYNLNTVLQLK